MINKLIQISDLALRLGKVERATIHPDGSKESVTTHSMMLALFVASAESSFVLNRDRVIALAVIHDLVEAYCGDTNTAVPLNPVQKEEKDKREKEAYDRLIILFEDNLYMLDLLTEYEYKMSKEAMFVYYCDKMMPKVTNRLSGGRQLIEQGIEISDAIKFHHNQNEGLLAYTQDFKAHLLFKEIAQLKEEKEMEDEIFCKVKDCPNPAAGDFCGDHVHTITASGIKDMPVEKVLEIFDLDTTLSKDFTFSNVTPITRFMVSAEMLGHKVR